jgi:ABC-type polysaccharide/polyol phosphate transport system ATPase subunit
MGRTDAWMRLDNVGVDIPIYDASTRSLKNSIIAATGGGRLSTSADRVVVKALEDVSLEFHHGDRVGLVGHNGAGKSTLLRVLAGVYQPTSGTIRSRGRSASLFDLSLGIDMEGTGYENIHLRGLMLGMTRKEVAAKMDEIAEVTGLGDYLAMPVRTYSSGMRLRLAFAVSTCIDADILLLDEWLSVGDAHFVEKAQKRLRDLVARSGILVLASHSNELIQTVCNKAVFLEKGRVVAFGSCDDVLKSYAAAA